jgi:hypothetical protein
MTFGAKTHAPEEFWHITSQFRHHRKLPKLTPELGEFRHETTPSDPRKRVLAVLAPDSDKLKIERKDNSGTIEGQEGEEGEIRA